MNARIESDIAFDRTELLIFKSIEPFNANTIFKLATPNI